MFKGVETEEVQREGLGSDLVINVLGKNGRFSGQNRCLLRKL